MLRTLLLTCLLTTGAAAPGTVAAQDVRWGGVEEGVLPGPSLVLFGGALHRTDLLGEGTDALVGGGARLHLGEVIRLEPTLRYTRFTVAPDLLEGNAEAGASFLLLDFQLQAELPLGRARPWLGVGAGGAMDLRGSDRGDEEMVMTTFTVSVGVTVGVLDHLDVLADGRLRTLDGFDRSGFDLTLGLAWEP